MANPSICRTEEAIGEGEEEDPSTNNRSSNRQPRFSIHSLLNKSSNGYVSIITTTPPPLLSAPTSEPNSSKGMSLGRKREISEDSPPKSAAIAGAETTSQATTPTTAQPHPSFLELLFKQQQQQQNLFKIAAAAAATNGNTQITKSVQLHHQHQQQRQEKKGLSSPDAKLSPLPQLGSSAQLQQQQEQHLVLNNFRHQLHQALAVKNLLNVGNGNVLNNGDAGALFAGGNGEPLAPLTLLQQCLQLQQWQQPQAALGNDATNGELGKRQQLLHSTNFPPSSNGASSPPNCTAPPLEHYGSDEDRSSGVGATGCTNIFDMEAGMEVDNGAGDDEHDENGDQNASTSSGSRSSPHSPAQGQVPHSSLSHQLHGVVMGKSNKKKKKTRTVFSRQQVAQLESMFNSRRYLSSHDRSQLAASLSLTEVQVKIWFQNRRNKMKRVQGGVGGDITTINEDQRGGGVGIPAIGGFLPMLAQLRHHPSQLLGGRAAVGPPAEFGGAAMGSIAGHSVPSGMNFHLHHGEFFPQAALALQQQLHHAQQTQQHQQLLAAQQAAVVAANFAAAFAAATESSPKQQPQHQLQGDKQEEEDRENTSSVLLVKESEDEKKIHPCQTHLPTMRFQDANSENRD